MMFSCVVASVSAQNQKQSEIARVELAFAGKSLDEINSWLTAMRPPAVDPADKLLLMRELPFCTPANRIENPRELDRLRKRLVPVLKLYARDGVVDLVLFRDPRPIVYSRAGVVVAISTEVLKIVGEDDAALAGIIAHELAHEYVALQLLQALQAKDLGKIRELELFCDGVAVVMMLDLGLDPARYGQILETIANHSQAAAVLNNGSNSHPEVAARRRVISDLSARFKKALHR